AYLIEREQDAGVYLETLRPLRLLGGGIAEALVFMADVRHPQYAGLLPLDEQLALVRGAKGESGYNTDYVLQTVDGLAAMAIGDRHRSALATLLRAETQRA